MCSCVHRIIANPMNLKKKKKKKPISLGGYTHGEELIINLLSTFFQIYIFLIYLFIG